MIKKYVVFYGLNYYPGGGVNDFVNSFATSEKAKDYLLTQTYDWAQIWNIETGEILSYKK